MIASVARSNLYRALDRVAPAASRNETMNVLRSVLIDAAGEELRLTATDLELTIQTTAPANVEDPGRVAVPIATLRAAVASMPDDMVRLRADGQHLELGCGRAHVELFGVPAEDYPNAIPRPVDWLLEIDGSVLARMLRAVAPAASKDPNRPALNGVFLERRGGQIACVATDGARMAVWQATAADGEYWQALIPTRAAKEIADLADGHTVRLGLHDTTHFVLQTPWTLLVSRLVGASFPDWRAVFPDNWSVVAHVDADRLRGALRRVLTTARDLTHTVRVNISGRVLDMQSRTDDVGRSHEDLTLEQDATGPATFAVNGELLLRGLAPVRDGSATLRIADSLRPILIEAGDYRYLIAPLRLHG
jgi:DNA polymerase-3 subunit beta